jgi:hypothetical protein
VPVEPAQPATAAAGVGRRNRVKIARAGVGIASGDGSEPAGCCSLLLVAPSGLVRRSRARMADVVFVALTVAVFALLGLTVRAVGRL